MRNFLLTILTAVFLLPGLSQSRVYNVTLTKENTLDLRTYFYDGSVGKVLEKAQELDSRLPSKEHLFLVLDSGGGSISAGLELITGLRSLNRPVHTISSFSASMGFQTVQGLGKRLITPGGTLMSHKAWGVFYGEFPGQVDSRYSFWIKRLLRMDKVTVERTRGVHTLESYRKLYENEYWCEGQECIDQGFADLLVQPKCDKSLSGTKWVEYSKFLYRGQAIQIGTKIANCPTITGILDYNIFINGNPLFNPLNFIDRETEYNTYTGLTEQELEFLKQKVEGIINSEKSNTVKVTP